MERILQGGMERGYGTGVWNGCGPGACSGPHILTCTHLDTTYLFVSLGPGGGKIQKDTFRYDVSFCIFCPASGRYIKIHKDTFRYILKTRCG